MIHCGKKNDETLYAIYDILPDIRAGFQQPPVSLAALPFIHIIGDPSMSSHQIYIFRFLVYHDIIWIFIFYLKSSLNEKYEMDIEATQTD